MFLGCLSMSACRLAWYLRRISPVWLLMKVNIMNYLLFSAPTPMDQWFRSALSVHVITAYQFCMTCVVTFLWETVSASHQCCLFEYWSPLPLYAEFCDEIYFCALRDYPPSSVFVLYVYHTCRYVICLWFYSHHVLWTVSYPSQPTWLTMGTFCY